MIVDHVVIHALLMFRDRAVANLKADADRFAKNIAPIIREIQSTGFERQLLEMLSRSWRRTQFRARSSVSLFMIMSAFWCRVSSGRCARKET